MSEPLEMYFKDFIKLNRGFDLPESNIVAGKYPIAASTSIKDFHKEFKVKAPCVTTGRSGSLGSVLYINQDCWPLNTTLYVKDFKGNNPKYVYYFLQTMKLESFNSGAGVPTLNQNHLHKVKVKIHKKEEQHRIAFILSAYDDLIENNNRRITLLEQMAEQIYKEWFVRMRFPGYENTEFEKGVPKGWEVKKFKDVLNYKTGKLDSNAMIIDGTYDFYTCSKEIYKTNTFCFNGEAVLLGGNNASGDFSLFYANDKFDAYQRTYIVTSKNKALPLVYVYYVLQSYLSYFQNVSVGATTKFLTVKILDLTYILVPDKHILDKYFRMVKPAFDKVLVLKAQTQTLIQTRDLLLPRLISGKLRVNAAEKELEKID